jgi:catechol 2,3-dioxygenase-like lactoylglutathione lyase family enzyme
MALSLPGPMEVDRQTHVLWEVIMVNAYVEASEQLVVELYVRNIKESCAFYRQFGFEVVRDAGDFVELQWENTRLFLEEIVEAPLPPLDPVGNIRVMVPNVDEYWTLSGTIGARVIRPIENRDYGLRDFTIAGPDGLGLRFATHLADIQEASQA